MCFTQPLNTRLASRLKSMSDGHNASFTLANSDVFKPLKSRLLWRVCLYLDEGGQKVAWSPNQAQKPWAKVAQQTLVDWCWVADPRDLKQHLPCQNTKASRRVQDFFFFLVIFRGCKRRSAENYPPITELRELRLSKQSWGLTEHTWFGSALQWRPGLELTEPRAWSKHWLLTARDTLYTFSRRKTKLD